ncbi:unnamed protein product [Sympodiomycopsis kandeliae]
MAPKSTVIICRHSQAEHNVRDEYHIPDAPLTKPIGVSQAAKLPDFTKQLQGQVDLIITSPLKRTLQTTLLGWKPAVERLGQQNVICLPQLQECNAYPCDTGSPRAQLEADPEIQGFNLELLTPDWTSKQGQYAADEQTLNARAQWVRQFVRSRPEKNILLVGHGDIIRRITGGPLGNSTHAWKNAEVRTYEFDPAHVDTPQAWLTPEGNEVASGGWEPTSTEFAGSSGPKSSSSGLLPSFGTGESGSLDLGGSILAELEGKIAEKQESVQTKAKELDDLEERLRQAEAKKQALEAKGIRM